MFNEILLVLKYCFSKLSWGYCFYSRSDDNQSYGCSSAISLRDGSQSVDNPILTSRWWCNVRTDLWPVPSLCSTTVKFYFKTNIIHKNYVFYCYSYIFIHVIPFMGKINNPKHRKYCFNEINHYYIKFFKVLILYFCLVYWNYWNF